VIWAFIAELTHGVNFEGAAIYFLEVWCGFLLAKEGIRNIDELFQFVKLYALFFLLLFPFALYEAATGYRMLHVAASNISGIPTLDYLGDKYIRFGVHRSSTSFSHPILYGYCAAAIFPLLLYKEQFRKFSIYWVGIIGAVATSLTSAGILMIAASTMMTFLKKLIDRYDRIDRKLVAVFLGALLFVELLSNRGAFKFIMSLVALNPQTAYMRHAQIEHVTDDILSNPWFGTGGHWTRPWWMPGSLDNYWYSNALNYGIPSILLILIFWFLLSKKLYALKNQLASLPYLCFASMSIILVGAFTVDLFDRAQPVTFILLGLFSKVMILASERESTYKRNVI
jgi:hypothetical protein